MKSTRKTKLISSKPLEAAGSQPTLSAKIGGIGNTPPNAAKDESKKGGK